MYRLPPGPVVGRYEPSTLHLDLIFIETSIVSIAPAFAYTLRSAARPLAWIPVSTSAP